MTTIARLQGNIYRLRSGHATYDSSVYLVADRQSAIVETGPTRHADEVLEALSSMGQDATGLYIILTHVHMDHAGGVGYLTKRLPNARVVIHEGGVRHLVDPSRLIASTKRGFGHDFEAEYGPILAVPRERILPVRGGETLSLGETELQILSAPGHISHHICVYEPRSRGLFVGEALGHYMPEAELVFPASAAPGFDLEVALETMAKIRKLAPSILFFSHYIESRQVQRLIDIAERSVKGWGEVLLQAARAGESQEEMTRRLTEFLGENPQARKALADYGPLHLLLEGYLFYFRKKRMI